jgi:hypothetical protein
VSDIVEEVEQEVRRERWAAFLKKWGWWIGGALLAVILSVAAWEVWKAVGAGQAAGAADVYMAAQEKLADGDAKAATEGFAKLSASGPSAYRVAALTERAARLEEAGDLAGALKAMDEAARLAEHPGLKATAAFRAALLAADVEDFAAIQARVKPLIDAGGPISLLARELLGVEAAEAGQTAIAEEQFTFLRDALDAPPALQQRASAYLFTLTPTTASGASSAQSGAPVAAPTAAPPQTVKAGAPGDKK